jgi:Zn finger protein HypA/HybF involved in hydrogenase expression
MAEAEYIEIKVKCTECGKEMKIVTLTGTDTSDYLCPKCSTGDFLADEDEG